MIIGESAPKEELERADPYDKQQVVSKSCNHSHRHSSHTLFSLLLIRVLNAKTADVMSLYVCIAGIGLWPLEFVGGGE